MAFNPYETLGVERDADAATIRKAYRRKAAKAHPDAGGSHDDFTDLGRALAILVDEDARAHYDRTGEEKRRQSRHETPEQVRDRAAHEILTHCLVSIFIDDAIPHDHADIVRLMTQMLAEGVRKTSTQAAQYEKVAKRAGKRIDRFKRKHVGDGPNRLEEALRWIVKDANDSANKARTVHSNMVRALEMVHEYVDTPEKAQFSASWFPAYVNPIGPTPHT